MWTSTIVYGALHHPTFETMRMQMQSWPRLTRLNHNLMKKLQIFQMRSWQSFRQSWLAWTRRSAMSVTRPGAHVVVHSWPRWKQQMQQCIKKRWTFISSRLWAHLTTSFSSLSRWHFDSHASMVMVERKISCFI